jgi:hypothetical protein
VIQTSLRPEYRREIRLAKQAAKRSKFNAEQLDALLARAKARHEERKAAR